MLIFVSFTAEHQISICNIIKESTKIIFETKIKISCSNYICCHAYQVDYCWCPLFSQFTVKGFFQCNVQIHVARALKLVLWKWILNVWYYLSYWLSVKGNDAVRLVFNVTAATWTKTFTMLFSSAQLLFLSLRLFSKDFDAGQLFLQIMDCM